MINLTNEQARRFILLKHGLIDEYRYAGKPGVMAYVRQTGCIQFDPVDVCGKNAELVLQSRVKGFTKAMLHSLLYEDRELVDCFDKQLAIIPLEDWPHFERFRQIARDHVADFPEMHELMKQAGDYINANGAVNSAELPPEFDGELKWRSAVHWSPGKNKARAVLEQMYSEGKLVIHHKKGTRKYYDLAEKHIPADILSAADPLPDDSEYNKWRVLRRIGAIGLLWNRPSDAWLGFIGFNAELRNECFRSLLAEGLILEVAVDGIKDTFYCRTDDKALLETAMSNQKLKPRCELIAPLDCLLWDRKLINALFDFNYVWEIYHPPQKRKYAYYALPILFGDNIIGRIEVVNDRKTKTLVVRNIWYEESTKQTKVLSTALNKCIDRFARFNKCDKVTMLNM